MRITATKAEISNTQSVTARHNYVIFQNYTSDRYHSRHITFLSFCYTNRLFVFTRYSCKKPTYRILIFRRIFWAYRLSGVSLRSYASASLILWKVNLSLGKQDRRQCLHPIIGPFYIYVCVHTFAACVFEDIINICGSHTEIESESIYRYFM